MVRYIEKGDIFQLCGVTSYAHGCNCAGAMGKGIAVRAHAGAYRVYQDVACKDVGDGVCRRGRKDCHAIHRGGVRWLDMG